MKFLLVIITIISLVSANEYKIDLLDDIFDMDLETLQELKVKSASKSSQSLNFTPARVVVITKEKIEQRGYRGLDELLNDLPGFQIMRHADSGILNQVGIRGIMGTNYFKILQDGIEIDTTNGEVMSVSKQYPLFGVDRVEILYGAASVVHGADALSGVINIVSSKTPDDEIGVIGSHDGYRYVYGVKSLNINDGKFSVKAHYHQDQDYEFEKEYPDDYILSTNNSEFDYQPHISKSISARFEKGGFDTGVSYRYSSESTLTAMTAANSITNVFDNNSNLNSEMISCFVRYNAEILDNIDSTTTLSYDSTELLIDSYFINKYTSYTPAYKYSFSKRYALEETLSKSYGDHNLIFGISYEWFESTPMTYDLSSQSLGGNLYFNGSTIAVPIYHEKWNNRAIYMQDQIKLSDNLQLSLAARYDKSSSYGSSLNPRFALINSDGKYTQKLIYSQAFLAPSNYQKYKIYGNPLLPSTKGDGNTYMTSFFRVPNPDLKPERSKSYEYNLDLLLDRNTQLSFSTYYTVIKDVILIEESIPSQCNYIPDTTIDDPRGAINTAKSQIYGADISYESKSYFSGYDINYWGNYSFVDGEIEYEKGSKLPFLANHTFKSGATLRYADFKLSPSIRWMGPVKASTGGTVPTVGTHCVTNLFASYDFDKFKKIAIRIDNLFNEHYYGVRYNDSSKYKSSQDTRLITLEIVMKF